MILAAFFIFAALGSLTLGPWDYFSYEPPSVDDLAEEECFFANEPEQDLSDDERDIVLSDGTFL